MVRFLMEKARTSGVPQEIGPLNSYSRRLVHLEVAETADMESESVGIGATKLVTIRLKASAPLPRGALTAWPFGVPTRQALQDAPRSHRRRLACSPPPTPSSPSRPHQGVPGSGWCA